MGNIDPAGAESTPESQRTECMSSNATLFWRVFVPIFGTVFLLGLVMALCLIDEENLFLPFPAIWVRVIAIAIFLGWILLVKRSIWRLKRADANSTHLFVTNYWHTVRYPWAEIESVTETRRLGRRIVHFHLRAAGRLGQVISILPASHFEELMVDFGQKLVELD